MTAMMTILVSAAISQRKPVHISRMYGPSAFTLWKIIQFSIWLPKATSMVANPMGKNEASTSVRATARSFSMPQVLGS